MIYSVFRDFFFFILPSTAQQTAVHAFSANVSRDVILSPPHQDDHQVLLKDKTKEECPTLQAQKLHQKKQLGTSL